MLSEYRYRYTVRVPVNIKILVKENRKKDLLGIIPWIAALANILSLKAKTKTLVIMQR